MPIYNRSSIVIYPSPTLSINFPYPLFCLYLVDIYFYLAYPLLCLVPHIFYLSLILYFTYSISHFDFPLYCLNLPPIRSITFDLA